MNRPADSLSQRTDRSRDMLLVFPNHRGIEFSTMDGHTVATITLPSDRWNQAEELAAEFLAARRSLGQRFTRAVLVLPRFAYALKYFTLPNCHPSELREALENQIELNSMFSADEVKFDSFCFEPDEPTVASNSTHGLYIVPKSAVAVWKKALQAANWELVAMTTQTQVAVESTQSFRRGNRCLIVVANMSGVELILCQDDSARTSRFVESGTNEPCDMHRVLFEINRLPGREAEQKAAVYTDVLVVGSLAEEVARQLIAAKPELAKIVRCQSHIPAADNPISSTAVSPFTKINLLRETLVTSPETLRKRRRIRLMAASILVLLTGLLIYDRVVRRYDDAIETLTTEIASNEQLLARGQSLEDVYLHLAERQNQQRDWLADLDAICRELEQEDAVRLTTIRGETALDQRAAVLRFSGVAPDSTTVTRMIERYASDAGNVDVTPLGLRPYLNEGISGVQFDLQLKRSQARSQETRP